jgi:type II secretory ATPase GspE/PulE/Tfp pilus assembly ATPase PilB-like protein
LLALLRHAPDVVMVGEIRDVTTAKITLEAAAAGLAVFATVHASTAAGAIDSMLERDANPKILAGVLRGVIAQRMLQQNCPDCLVPDSTWHSSFDFSDVEPMLPAGVTPSLRRGRGCEQCEQLGHRGQLGLFEVMRVSAAIRTMIASGASSDRIETQAIEEGLLPIRLSAKLALARGLSSVAEALPLLGLDLSIRRSTSETISPARPPITGSDGSATDGQSLKSR